MRYTGVIEGFVVDFNSGKSPDLTKILVNYTSDSIGKTLSLGSELYGIQISIPYDQLIKILK